MNIYIDESGDLGSSKKSGKYFIVGLVAVEHSRTIDIWMRRVRSRKLPKKARKIAEVKASLAGEKFKKYFYTHLNKLAIKIVFVILDKNKIPSQFRKEQGLIYLNMVKAGLTIFIGRELKKSMIVTIDRKHFQGLTKDAFNTALKDFLLIQAKIQSPIQIHHLDSTSDRILQFTDFITYAATRKYNSRDLCWHYYLKKFIKKEIILKLPNKK